MTAQIIRRHPDAAKVLNALAQPLLTVDAQGMVIDVNVAAETFFDMGRGTLLRSRLIDLIPSDLPVLGLVSEALSNRATVNGYKIDISSPGSAIETMSMCSLRHCLRPTTLSQLCCRNAQLPKK